MNNPNTPRQDNRPFMPQVSETILRFLIEDNGGKLRISHKLATYISNWQMHDVAFDPDDKDPLLMLTSKLRETLAHRDKLKREQAEDNKRAQVARESFANLTEVGIDPKIASALVSLQVSNPGAVQEFIRKLTGGK